MLFKFPQRKIVLDCFTSQEHVINTSPILPAIKLIPDWWKELPTHYYKNDFVPTSTMKSCVGMVDYYKKSIVLPMWSDLILSVRAPNQCAWQFSDGSSVAVPHDMANQATGFLPNHAHLKLESPWLLKTKENIFWVWSHPAYNYPNSQDVVSLPATVNYSKQYNTNINLLFNTTTPKNILIPQGQPLVHMTPMSDKKVEIRRHLISKEEYANLRDSISKQIFFLNMYKKINARIDQFKDCPFHNHTKGN